MLEPLRSQYLAALGVDNYVPRFILPGAKLSEPCAWLETFDELANAEPTSTEPAQNEIIAPSVVDESKKPSPIAAQLATAIEPIVKRAVRASENAVAQPTKTAAKSANSNVDAGPKFALSIALAAGGILLIDDAPASSADRSAYQKLLNNMLPALRPAAAQYVLDIFLWPLTRQSQIPRDADAAKETLAAYLHKQIQQRAIDTVLLLGEAAQQWCTFADTDVHIVKSTSLLACVRDPALKRSLWNDIRHLGAAPQ